MAHDTTTRRADALLRTGVGAGPALFWLWVYAAVTGVLAIGLGGIVVTATQAVLPGAPIRLATTAIAVVVAGLACERVLASIVEAARRR